MDKTTSAPDHECACLQCEDLKAEIDRLRTTGREVERLKAENARLRVAVSRCLLGDTGGDCYAAECVDLRAEVERLRAIERRYNWLDKEGGLYALPYDDYGLGPMYDLDPDKVDAAMTAAAMQKQANQGEQ